MTTASAWSSSVATADALRPSRYVVITGDDFGSSHSVNEAILEAHQRGVLTSASLMVTGEAVEEAVALAQRHPTLAVGLHLVLISGKSALPHRQIPLLVDRGGRFSSNPALAGLLYQLHPQARNQVRQEIRAQLERFRQTGLRISHVDGHRHMHLPPVVLETLVNLSKEFGIRAIRLPREELGINLRLDRQGWLEKAVLSLTFSLLSRGYARDLLRSSGIECADRVYGLLQNGRMTEDYLLGLIPQIQADRVEIYSHLSSRAQQSALLSDRVRQVLIARGFQLATYSELVGCTDSRSPSFSFSA